MTKPSPPRVAILGAGPAGLEAAAYGRSLGWPVAVYEQGVPGAHVERWGFVRMFTPFGANVSPLGRQAILREAPLHEFPPDTALLTGAEYKAAYLTPLAGRVGKVRLIHGEREQALALADTLRDIGFTDVAVPEPGDRVAI